MEIFPQLISESQRMINQLCSEVNDQEDDRECLSDSHRDFLQRYIQFELERQEKVSERFLRERSQQSKRSIRDSQ